MLTAKEAIKRLEEGNKKYLTESIGIGDVSPSARLRTSAHGQQPYAIIITCSDSRVIPESIFAAGIGELFVIRVAGNVIDDHQLGSIEYAKGHLGCNLIVVMGHTHCGAIEAAMHGAGDDEEGSYIASITDIIRHAIHGEIDDYNACFLNVKNSVQEIEKSQVIAKAEKEEGLKVVGAIYHIEDGHVEFLRSKRRNVEWVNQEDPNLKQGDIKMQDEIDKQKGNA